VHLASELAASVPSIVGDPSRLQQVIWNLVSNAIKFSQKGGRVDVSLKLAGPAVEVVVADQGQGISAEFLPYVFEPFRQQDASSSRTHGGLGLGLAISRQIVELHGGKISAESPGQRRGATFTVSLPIVASTLESAPRRSAEPAQAATSLDSPAHLRGLHVLVVDDDDDARQLVASVLEDCGCRVSVANSARAALNRLIEDSPEVLLSDVAMPGEDGYELIRKVRSLPRERGGAIPAAALTAYARPEDRRRLLNAGFSIHLPKPIEPAELVAVVSTLSRFVRR
jgi:CheY-like chemotaxis protein